MIQLNIRYDPEYPFDWVPEQEYWERRYPPGRKPKFPYSWRDSGLRIGRWTFKRRHVNTRGFDPYAGEEWSLEVGRWLRVELSTLVCASAKLEVWGLSLESREYEWRKMPWAWRRLLEFLEYRHEWFERNEYSEDPYGSLGDYE